MMLDIFLSNIKIIFEEGTIPRRNKNVSSKDIGYSWYLCDKSNNFIFIHLCSNGSNKAESRLQVKGQYY